VWLLGVPFEVQAEHTMKVQSLRELRDEMRAVAQGEQPAQKDASSPSFESTEALQRLARNRGQLRVPQQCGSDEE